MAPIHIHKEYMLPKIDWKFISTNKPIENYPPLTLPAYTRYLVNLYNNLRYIVN